MRPTTRFALLAAVLVARPAGAAVTTRAIVFLWDGTQRAHMLQLYDAQPTQLPRLHALVAAGGLLRTDVTIDTDTCLPGSGDGYETETGPANSAIVTGYGYPEQGNQDNGAPGPIPAGRTFFERVKAAHPEVRTGMITSKHYDFWPLVPLQNAQGSIDHWYTEQVDNPRIADEAITFLRNNRSSPFFLWVHFRFPDENGHQFGENSPQYGNSLIGDDTQTGRVLDEVAALGLAADTTVFVTTDHGFEEDGTQHEACTAETKNVWLASNRAAAIGRVGVAAHQTSIAPTLFDLFGICKNVTPAFPSESLWTGTPACCTCC